MHTKEIWMPCAGYDGKYYISSFGRVFSAKIHNGKRDGNILRGWVIKNGYRAVSMGKRPNNRTHYVHELVLTAFVGPRPDGMVCNHKDGNKINARLDNLEWVTPKENSQHAEMFGLTNHFKGEGSPKAVLTEEQVKHIRAMPPWPHGPSTRALARMYGVGKTTLWAAKSGKNWRGIDEMGRKQPDPAQTPRITGGFRKRNLTDVKSAQDKTITRESPSTAGRAV